MKTLDIYIRAHGAADPEIDEDQGKFINFKAYETYSSWNTQVPQLKVAFYWRHSDVVERSATDCEILKAILRNFTTPERRLLLENQLELLDRFCKTEVPFCEELNNLHLSSNFSLAGPGSRMRNYNIVWDDSMNERLVMIGSDRRIQVLRPASMGPEDWPKDLRSMIRIISGLDHHGRRPHPLKRAVLGYEQVNIHWTICRGDGYFGSWRRCVLHDGSVENPTECLQKVCVKLDRLYNPEEIVSEISKWLERLEDAALDASDLLREGGEAVRQASESISRALTDGARDLIRRSPYLQEGLRGFFGWSGIDASQIACIRNLGKKRPQRKSGR